MTIQQQVTVLEPYVSERRLSLIDNALDHRTHKLQVVLEDVYQPQNASAVLRTCECLGIQNVHIIENRNPYELNPRVVLGASKWLDIHHHNEGDENTVECLLNLKAQGYRIMATSLHHHSINLEQIVMNKPTALVFGTELSGISKQVEEMADDFVTIPMFGFTESFNLSVSAAIILTSLLRQMREQWEDWELDAESRAAIKLDWLKKVVRRSDLILERAME